MLQYPHLETSSKTGKKKETSSHFSSSSEVKMTNDASANRDSDWYEVTTAFRAISFFHAAGRILYCTPYPLRIHSIISPRLTNVLGTT